MLVNIGNVHYYGNRAGGLKAYKSNIERHGEDFYKKIGRKGGLHPTGSFGVNPALASAVGRKGGMMSKVGYITPEERREIERDIKYAKGHPQSFFPRQDRLKEEV